MLFIYMSLCCPPHLLSYTEQLHDHCPLEAVKHNFCGWQHRPPRNLSSRLMLLAAVTCSHKQLKYTLEFSADVMLRLHLLNVQSDNFVTWPEDLCPHCRLMLRDYSSCRVWLPTCTLVPSLVKSLKSACLLSDF